MAPHGGAFLFFKNFVDIFCTFPVPQVFARVHALYAEVEGAFPYAACVVSEAGEAEEGFSRNVQGEEARRTPRR